MIGKKSMMTIEEFELAIAHISQVVRRSLFTPDEFTRGVERFSRLLRRIYGG